MAADVARLSGHPDQALLPLLRRLLRLDCRRDPRAPYAAFILGRVLLEELHQPHDAALTFARVREIDPVTPLASDAGAQVLAWARTVAWRRRRQRADDHVRAYPGGARLERYAGMIPRGICTGPPRSRHGTSDASPRAGNSAVRKAGCRHQLWTPLDVKTRRECAGTPIVRRPAPVLLLSPTQPR